MNIGIDKIGFYTSPFFVDLSELANARGVDPNKYLIGIGQKKQAVIPPSQDVVTMAANAADSMLSKEDKKKIDLIIFGTETGVDNSKSAAIYIQSLLGISNNARAFEIKQACYGGTAGVQMAIDHIRSHPDSKVLVLAADIARYGLKTPGEVTQGGGAISMLISKDPRILAINTSSTFFSKNIMDFWRPIQKKEAIVDGHYSTDIYIDFFLKTWSRYQKLYGQNLNNFKAIIFHLPFSKMGKKALNALFAKESGQYDLEIKRNFDFSKIYSSLVGNLYTGSLYLSLVSLLANSNSLKKGDQIGLFSYGSGAQGEFYTGKIQSSVPNLQLKNNVESLLNSRTKLSVPNYEKIYRDGIRADSENIDYDISSDHSKYVLSGRKQNQLKYLKQK